MRRANERCATAFICMSSIFTKLMRAGTPSKMRLRNMWATAILRYRMKRGRLKLLGVSRMDQPSFTKGFALFRFTKHNPALS